MQGPVYILLDSSSFGGIESHVLVLAKALATHCQVEVLLWRLYRADHPLLARLTDAGIAYQVLHGRLQTLVQLCKSQPNVALHCHGYKANIIGRLVALWCQCRCVCTFHNGEVGEGRVRLYTLLDSWTSALSENIAVSQEIAKRVVGSCRVMPNRVEVDTQVPLCNEPSGSIAFVGRLEQVKRPDRFFDLARQCPDLNFAVWGNGSLAAELALDAPTNLSMKGAVPSMTPFWPGIDVLVICSDHEGCPMVALEAMAAGVPVIALALGELPILIEQGVTGFIAESMDELTQYIRQWHTLSSDMRRQIRQAAQQRIANDYSSAGLWPALAPLYFADQPSHGHE